MHVKRRILAQPDHIKIGQIHLALRGQNSRVSRLSLYGHIVATRGYPSGLESQIIRSVLEQGVPARLRLFGQPERAVGIDINPGDRVHLKGDFHGNSPATARQFMPQSFGGFNVF